MWAAMGYPTVVQGSDHFAPRSWDRNEGKALLIPTELSSRVLGPQTGNKTGELPSHCDPEIGSGHLTVLTVKSGCPTALL